MNQHLATPAPSASFSKRKKKKAAHFKIGQRIQAKFAIRHSLRSLSEYRRECLRLGGHEVEPCRIDAILQLDTSEYDHFSRNLLESNPLLAAGGTESDSLYQPGEHFEFATEEQENDWFAKSFRCVTLIAAPSRVPFVVDPQGCLYARYVGIDLQLHKATKTRLTSLPGRRLVNPEEDIQAVILEADASGSGELFLRLAVFNAAGQLQGEEEFFLTRHTRTNWCWLCEENPDFRKMPTRQIRELEERLSLATFICDFEHCLLLASSSSFFQS